MLSRIIRGPRKHNTLWPRHFGIENGRVLCGGAVYLYAFIISIHRVERLSAYVCSFSVLPMSSTVFCPRHAAPPLLI